MRKQESIFYNTNSTNFCHFFNANTDSSSCRSKGEYNTGDLNVQLYSSARFFYFHLSLMRYTHTLTPPRVRYHHFPTMQLRCFPQPGATELLIAASQFANWLSLVKPFGKVSNGSYLTYWTFEAEKLIGPGRKKISLGGERNFRSCIQRTWNNHASLRCEFCEKSPRLCFERKNY